VRHLPLDPDVIEKIRKELCEYEIGKEDLCIIVDPLLEKCSAIAKDEKDFKTCLKEAVDTIKKTISK
jgi:hypothetical protein